MDPDAPPPIPPGISADHLHFARAQVQVGDPAPDFTLPLAHGDGAHGSGANGAGTVTLSALRGAPVVLVFGSFT